MATDDDDDDDDGIQFRLFGRSPTMGPLRDVDDDDVDDDDDDVVDDDDDAMQRIRDSATWRATDRSWGLFRRL